MGAAFQPPAPDNSNNAPTPSAAQPTLAALAPRAEVGVRGAGSLAPPEARGAAERWGEGSLESPGCTSYRESAALETVDEGDRPPRLFSAHGYMARHVRVERIIDGALRRHCVRVAWPPGDKTIDGKRSDVARRIDDGWLRAIENTLARLPWSHLQVVRRVVIDNRPTEHGIAPFDRRSVDDGRDGHTIWLHERLFEEPNHWARGNHGSYWSFHLERDGETLDDRSPDHPHFSPVLLHEIGHLVAYNVVNRGGHGEVVPACARVCGDEGGCRSLSDEARERGCISAYCMPFKVETGTENWAEQYRFFYQGSVTRALLERSGSACFALLADPARGLNAGRPAPWEVGLTDATTFHRTRWRSCGERACKAF